MTRAELVHILCYSFGLADAAVRVTDVPGSGHVYIVVDAKVPSQDVVAVLRYYAPLGFLWIVVTDFYAPPGSSACGCCDRGDEYNGFGSGPLLFVCPKHCACHD